MNGKDYYQVIKQAKNQYSNEWTNLFPKQVLKPQGLGYKMCHHSKNAV